MMAPGLHSQTYEALLHSYEVRNGNRQDNLLS